MSPILHFDHVGITVRQIDLSAKEFAVLETLLKAAPRRPQRRRPPRPGMGRKRRPVHENGSGHHQPAPSQTRRPAAHPDHPRRRLPDHRPRSPASP